MKKQKIQIINADSVQGKKLFTLLAKKRSARSHQIEQAVRDVLDDIQTLGDKALFAYTKKFDHKVISPKTVRLRTADIKSQAQKVPSSLKTTIREAAKRIRQYHARQKIDRSFSLKTSEGTLYQRVKPLKRVGVYVPGGYTVYPSSVLMNVIPAQIAGVKEIVAVTPPHDELHPLIAYALSLLKVEEVYQIGGAQAVGALAYGTKSVPAVEKIVGPGNSYVAIAKKLVYGTVDIDSVAGPSEVAILADESVDPSWVALDLLSQAEHGSGDEIAICITEQQSYAENIKTCLLQEIEQSPVRKVFEQLQPDAILILLCQTREQSIEYVNRIAPEHLQIMTKTAKKDLEKIDNAAAIFVGPYTPVALGDYYVGTNHVLPTGAAARYASGLGVDSFLKRISVAHITKPGINSAAKHVSQFARAENFIHHALSVERRTD